jgi:hypothetical protein
VGSEFFVYDISTADSLLSSRVNGELPIRTCDPKRVDSLATSSVQVRIGVPRDRAEGVIALRRGRIVTMRGD